MRIALVAQNGSPLSPATEQHPVSQAVSVAAHARGLAKLGHRVTIYARRDARALPGSAILAPQVTVEHVAAGPLAPLSAGELAANVAPFGDYLAQRWRRNAPDLVHAYYWTSGLAALAASRGSGIPLVQTFGSLGAAEQHHGCATDAGGARIRMEGCLARSAQAVLAGTGEEAADVLGMGVPRAAVTVVPCGVDTQEFTPEGPAAKRGNRPRLLAVTRLGENQGLDALLRVLARVPGAELVIAGGPARSQLRKHDAYLHLTGLAQRLGVADRLSFTGRVTAEVLPALLRSADMLVSAAPYDPSGGVAIAAMACGTPVAAVAVGAYSDAVLDGTTGILVPPGHPEELARRIRDLLASPLRLEAYGIAAADRAGARYSWDRISREIVHVYERCLRPVPAPAAALAGARSG
jgi:glycosyltransferase involved in cell wall biosynthesis